MVSRLLRRFISNVEREASGGMPHYRLKELEGYFADSKEMEEFQELERSLARAVKD